MGSISVSGVGLQTPIWVTWESSSEFRVPSLHAIQPVGSRWSGRRAPRCEASLSLPTMFQALGLRRGGGVGGTALGIDLAARAHEVKKLFYASSICWSVQREGIDAEEFLQEIYRGLLARNQGTCPWDASKSSFGHYVHIVMLCVLSNYLRKDRRRTSVEELTGDEFMTGLSSEPLDQSDRRDVLKGLFKGEALEVAVQLVGYLESGLSRKEAGEALGIGLSGVTDILTRIKDGLGSR